MNNIKGPPLVHGVTWIEGRFGYNIHARNFFSSLAHYLPTTVSPLVMLEGPHLEDQTLLRRMSEPDAPYREIISIALLYGEFAATVLSDAPGRRIAYTVWESTLFPDAWLPSLAAMDEVWLPSHWGREIAIANGIPAQSVKVVPEGVDPAVFNPGVTPTTALAAKPGFKFLNIGKFEERKGTRLLIQAFDAEFGRSDDAQLVLVCDNPHEPDFDLVRELRAMNLKHPEKLIFIPPLARHDMLAPLYTACNAFVAPTRAEGWGLPIIEAMASGLPVIVTDYSAPRDFIGETAYRLRYDLAPITTAFFDRADGDYGVWADPDIAHLRHLMREIYENQEEAGHRGQSGSTSVRTAFSWDNAARTAARALAPDVIRS